MKNEVAVNIADLACLASMGRTDTLAELNARERVAYADLRTQAVKSPLARARFARKAAWLRDDRRLDERLAAAREEAQS